MKVLWHGNYQILTSLFFHRYVDPVYSFLWQQSIPFRWKFDDQNDKISFSLRVNTTGWVGFGFSKIAPNNIQDYDVIVGGFKDGQGYLNVSCCYSYEKSFPWSRGGWVLQCLSWPEHHIVRLWQQLESSPIQRGMLYQTPGHLLSTNYSNLRFLIECCDFFVSSLLLTRY